MLLPELHKTMPWKIILSLVALQLACIVSQNTDGLTKQQQQVQSSIFEKIVDHMHYFWKVTQPEQNIQFNPLAMFTSKNVMEIRSHYEGASALYFPKNRLLEIGYAFANFIDTLQQSSSVKLRLKNAIFYDQRHTNEQYLYDVKTRYHAEAFEVSFDSKNTASILALFDEWINKTTKGLPPKPDNPLMPGMSNFHTTVLTFVGCWDKPKTSGLIKTLRFKTATNEIEVPAFNAQETIGYYNNATSKYEAIRIPYKNEEFAMVIVLPYQNQTLDLFSKFAPVDYRQLLERVNENREKVDYAIPSMNSTMIILNKSGASVKGNDPVTCDESPTRETIDETNNNDYKSVYVNRPFGIFIYEEKTKIVLSHILVKNPNYGLSGYRRFSGKIAPRVKGEYPLIPSYVVFY